MNNNTIIRRLEVTIETKEERNMKWHGQHVPYTAGGVNLVQQQNAQKNKTSRM